MYQVFRLLLDFSVSRESLIEELSPINLVLTSKYTEAG